MFGYKLFRKRKDGTYGPLFINRKQRLEIGPEYPFESHPTKGYKFRPGWHILPKPEAKHLSSKGRVWCKVKFDLMYTEQRPESQGGTWYLGNNMSIVGEV